MLKRLGKKIMEKDKVLLEMYNEMKPGRWYPFLSDQEEQIDKQFVSVGLLEKSIRVVGICYRKPRKRAN